MTEVDPLRQTRRAGGIKGRGARVFVELGELEIGRPRVNQGFIFERKRDRTRRYLESVGDEHECSRCFEFVLNLGKERQEIPMHDQYVRLGVIDRVKDLRRRQPDVYREQHRAHHGHGEIAFKITVTVPIHHGNRSGMPHTKSRKAAGELPDALAQGLVVVALMTAIDDLLQRSLGERRMQQLFNQQGIGIRRGSRFDQVVLHVGSLTSRCKSNPRRPATPPSRYSDPGLLCRRSCSARSSGH